MVKPNILWIVSEDDSAYFTGCYGNSFATTPNIVMLNLPEINPCPFDELMKASELATLSIEALYDMCEKQIAFETYQRILTSEAYNVYDKIFALKSIDAINVNTPKLNQLFVPL